MPIKSELLAILACPACHGEIRHDEAKDTLNCQNPECRRIYPIKDEIPVMLIEEATIPEGSPAARKQGGVAHP